LDILSACVYFAQVHNINFALFPIELLIRVAQCSSENCQTLEKVEAEGPIPHFHIIGLFLERRENSRPQKSSILLDFIVMIRSGRTAGHSIGRALFFVDKRWK